MLRYLALFSLPYLLNSQSNLSIGNWTTHLPFNSGKFVTQSEEFIYYSTDFAILKINKQDLSYERLTRTEGLSDSKLNTIYFHKDQETLLVAYENATIDLITGQGVKTIVDIFNFNNIPIDKVINKISGYDENHVFISANYGLSLLDVRSGKFVFTLFTPNLKVFDCISLNNQYFMATESGIYFLELKGSEIIQNFNSWTRLDQNHGLPPNEKYFSSIKFNGSVYVSNASEIYQWKDQRFQSIFTNQDYGVNYLSSGFNYLLAGLHCKKNCGDLVAFFDTNLNYKTGNNECTAQNLYAIESENGTIWYADARWGFRYSEKGKDECKIITVSGPLTNNCFEIAALQDGIYVATGGVDHIFAPKYWHDGILKYKDNIWTSINSTLPELQSYQLHDILRIAEHPDKTKIYFASAGKGLLEYNRIDKTYELFNESNSPLESPAGYTGSVRLSGLAFDKENTLWITDYLAGSNGLYSLNSKGEWKKYGYPNSLFTEVKVDQNGFKWIVSRQSGGITVFDEGDPDISTDDRKITLTNSNTEMTSNDVRTVEIDLDGDVWVGTAEGPVVFECSSSIFSGDCKGSRRKVDQDGIIYYLLSSEVITTIAIDGANRKWFGTNNNGIFVQSPGGEIQINNFNTSNSPLLDNNILDITIDPKTGEAWIASAKGLQVYRSDATHAKDFFTGTPLVYPNPVTPDYNGPIAIKGLARDSRVKITDLEGRLVFETIANGGQAIWDGNDYLGRKVSSGVYLVFANTTQDFETAEAIVTKIVITR
jgi:ligand-binding sensor domain-containing protein